MQNLLAEASFFRSALLNWYDGEGRSLPWRQLWKASKDPYPVWVSEIMLQQTTMAVVVPAFERFIKKFPTVYDLAASSEEDLRLVIRGLGYYRRFAFLRKAAAALAAQGSKISWPRAYEEWLALPGIGPYTASALSSITLNLPYGVCDGNVERVLSRLLGERSSLDDPRFKKKLQQLAHQWVDSKRPGDFNQAVMELGQRICTPTQPLCHSCPVQAKCVAKAELSQHLCPTPKKRAAAVDIGVGLVVLLQDEQVLLHRRPESAKFLRGQLGFPTFLQTGRRWTFDGADLPDQNPLAKQTSRGTFRHSITNHRIRGEVFVLRSLPVSLKQHEWHPVPLKKVNDMLCSNLDRKAWKSIAAAINVSL